MNIPVKVTCPTCGPLTVRSTAIRVTLSHNPDLNRYEFQCTHCHAWISKPADDETVHLLTVTAQITPTLLPDIRSRRPDGPPLSEDDLISFGLALESAECPA